nr:uncharacterized protein LOC127307308 [Lolium perenne]
MAYYHGQVSSSVNDLENLQEQISKLSQNLHQLALQRGIILEDGPGCYDPYSQGHPYVVPTCHICGFQGHTAADCQRGYPPTQDCVGMNFAQQHGSYHNNYSVGWPENPTMTYRNNNPPISSFPPSYPMQGFRYEEESNCSPQQFYPASIHVPQHEEMLPAELNGPLVGQPSTPQVQAHTREFDDEEKPSLLSLEFNWSAENDPVRPVIIKEMKKIKDGRDLVEEMKKIEKKMKLSNIISSQLELELSAPEVSLDTCEVPTPSHVPEQTSQSTTEAATLEEERVAEIEEERSQTLEERESQLEFTSDLVEGPIPITPEDVVDMNTEDSSARVASQESESQVELQLVMQESAYAGLTIPLNDLFLSDFSAIALHYIIPSLKKELTIGMLHCDHAYLDNETAIDACHDTYIPHDRVLLRDACLDNAHLSHNDNCYPSYDTMLAVTYNSHHVLYCYNYIIGYSIDDLVGVSPITCASCSLCECTFRILLVHHSSRPSMVRVDIPWDPGGCMAW